MRTVSPSPAESEQFKRKNTREAFQSFMAKEIGQLNWLPSFGVEDSETDKNQNVLARFGGNSQLKLKPGVYETNVRVGRHDMVDKMNVGKRLENIESKKVIGTIVHELRTSSAVDIFRAIRRKWRIARGQKEEGEDRERLKIRVTDDGRIVPMYARTLPSIYIWPISDLLTDHKRAVEEYEAIANEVVKGYAIGMGKRRLELDFPKAASARDINLNAVMIHLKAAEKYHCTMDLSDKIHEAIAIGLTSNDPNKVKLANEILKLEQDLRDNYYKNKDPKLYAEENKAACEANVNELNDNINNLEAATKKLSDALPSRDIDVIKAEMQNTQGAMNKVNGTLRDIDREVTNYPEMDSKLYADYQKALANAKGKIDSAKELMDREKSQIAGLKAEQEKLGEKGQEFVKQTKQLFNSYEGLAKVQSSTTKSVELAGMKPDDRTKQLSADHDANLKQIKSSANGVDDAIKKCIADPKSKEKQTELNSATTKLHDSVASLNETQERIRADIKIANTSEALKTYADLKTSPEKGNVDTAINIAINNLKPADADVPEVKKLKDNLSKRLTEYKEIIEKNLNEVEKEANDAKDKLAPGPGPAP